ncbi:MAG TPA: hypothetical protein VGP26_30020 [Actinophytocola sp.]|jgi:hypothetical protein|nr:hypothetical protein [Actinophytocola sp.]
MRNFAIVTAPTALALSTSPVAAAAAPSLLRPSGRHPVGTTSRYLKDTSRADPWVPSVPYRELMVSVFYPAASSHGRAKQFMTETEARAVLDEAGVTDVPSRGARRAAATTRSSGRSCSGAGPPTCRSCSTS